MQTNTNPTTTGSDSGAPQWSPANRKQAWPVSGLLGCRAEKRRFSHALRPCIAVYEMSGRVVHKAQVTIYHNSALRHRLVPGANPVQSSQHSESCPVQAANQISAVCTVFYAFQLALRCLNSPLVPVWCLLYFAKQLSLNWLLCKVSNCSNSSLVV